MDQDERVTKILSLGKKIRKLETEADDHLKAVYAKFPDFEGNKFLSGAKVAFSMIITALHAKDAKTLEELVDKRFLSQFEKSSAIYGKMKSDKMKTSFVDSYNFGNSVYIKVLFEGSNITDKIKNLNEEWVFTKNIAQSGPDWYLSNIDRPS
jgi:predicted lipid-binding transport protein (Tim44 family)